MINFIKEGLTLLSANDVFILPEEGDVFRYNDEDLEITKIERMYDNGESKEVNIYLSSLKVK